MNVLESIRSVLEGRPRRRPIGVHMPVERGQVRRIRPPSADTVPEIEAPERMVLVLRVDSQREFAEVMLVHSQVEFVTSLDLIVSPERSSMPYRMVIQTDTRAVVWTTQLETLIGKFDPEALEALGDVSVGQAIYRTSLSSGTPLRGPLDPRWDFKAREGHVIRSMAADCTSTLLYDGPPLQLDPGCLAIELLATCDDFETTALKLLDIVAKYDITFDLDDVKVLEMMGALELSNWTDAFGFLGYELYESFWPLVEQALSTVHLPEDLIDDGSIGESAEERRAEAGTFRRRTGHRVVSASYVYNRDRESSVKLARKHGYQLIDV